MKNYFKDKKLVLLYAAAKAGIPIETIPGFFRDIVSGESLVISARGGAVSSDFNYFEEIEVNMLDGSKKIWKHKDLFEYMILMKPEEVDVFFKLNSAILSIISGIVEYWASVSVEKIMILSYADDCTLQELEDDIRNLKFDFSSIKVGGPELAAEFLLSDFCLTHAFSRKIKDDLRESIDPLDITLAQITGDDHDHWYEEGYGWTISSLGKIEAPAYLEDDDIDMGSYKSSNRFYYYSLNLSALNKLNALLDIPYRVKKILTDEQLFALNNEAPSILLDEIDYIAKEVFNQKVDDFKSDSNHSLLARRSAAWGADMYEALGGDGGDVYLSDGVIITPSGKLAEE